MNEFNPIDIKETLVQKLHPTIMMWNRLEGKTSTSSENLAKALRAEVRDALWMLTKQWQMGEFKADDAGSPVLAKILLSSSTLNGFSSSDGDEKQFEENVPLEAKVERKRIPFSRDGKDISFDIRLQMGLHWLKLLKKEELDFAKEYIKEYPFELPDKSRNTDFIYAHKNEWQHYASISGRSMDGYKLYRHIAKDLKNASENITTVDPEKSSLDKLGQKFKTWFESLYYQPEEEGNNTWLPDRLEYQFDCTSKSDEETRKLSSTDYYQGHLDWYAFDISETKQPSNAKKKLEIVDTFIPSHVKFDGMPDTRWWKFEDSKTNLGAITPSTTDLSKLLLIEFGLVYSNDWFLFPQTLPIGSLSKIEGLAVKNNFGETTWIKPTEKEGGSNVQWSVFKLRSEKQNNSLFLAPSAIKVHESAPVEEIALIRDEMANMVWGIESIVPMSYGKGEKGGEIALQVRQFHEKIVEKINAIIDEAEFYLKHLDSLGALSPALSAIKTEFERIISVLKAGDPEVYKLEEEFVIAKEDLAGENELREYVVSKKENQFKAPIHYQVTTSVPENWIPFVPVHTKDGTPNDTREIQLQRSTMLRTIDGDPLEFVKVKPKTSLLREGLDVAGIKKPYFIHEEEVPRSGVRVTQTFQRTRWVNGEIFVWLGMRKKVGRGEGNSGLAFDQIKSNGDQA